MHVTVLKCLMSGKFLMNNRADLPVALSAPPCVFTTATVGQGGKTDVSLSAKDMFEFKRSQARHRIPSVEVSRADAVDRQHSTNRFDELN
jgi:hypothetical protein